MNQERNPETFSGLKKNCCFKSAPIVLLLFPHLNVHFYKKSTHSRKVLLLINNPKWKPCFIISQPKNKILSPSEFKKNQVRISSIQNEAPITKSKSLKKKFPHKRNCLIIRTRYFMFFRMRIQVERFEYS